MDTRVENIIPMKCKKCRFVLLEHPRVRVEDSHGEPFMTRGGDDSSSLVKKGSLCVSEVWYVPEECMPQWMHDCMEKGDWVKGKIVCPKCGSRIGSYSFITGFKCPCGSHVVPPIHIVKSKVDFAQPFHISIPRFGLRDDVQSTSSNTVL